MSDLSIDELEKTAISYHELMVPALFEQYADQIVDEAKIEPTDKVLDIACGTGIVACTAADRLNSKSHVVGLDMNPGMVAGAEKQDPDIEWRQGKAEELAWDDQSFDVILSQFGLMFFEDRKLALSEMHRVLKPGGRIVISVFDSLDNIKAYKIMSEIFGRIVGDEVGQALSFPFSLGDVDELKSICSESGLDSARISSRQGKANFPDVRTMVLADVKGWFPLAGFVLDDSQIDEVVSKAETALEEFINDDGRVIFPLPAYFITCTKME
jgi:ubiquinone/menaquinone biosynthesis C-methylase UbiE